ncbi:MAG TPA: pentapeptide repeat-containing protein [bacterium]|nr:pentapeptide repeat-containing protein [bacterium]
METALQISFYVVGGVFLLGVLMVLVLIKDVFFHGRFSTILPTVHRVPTTALDAARATLKELHEALRGAQGEREDTIAYEIRHLEHRIEALEDKTYTDQSDYYDTAKARERVWREWRALHEQVRRAGFRERRHLRDRVEELREQYRRLDREVGEEYHRAVARDTLTLEELRTGGVLDPEVLRPEPPPGTAQATPGATGATGTEAGEGAEGAQPATTRHPTGRSGKWMSPLPPYPPAEGGLLGQADLARPEVQKSERTYVDPTLSTAVLPGAMLSGADLSRSSFAEVEFVGVQRFVNCGFVATDLRRIELRQAEAPHLFQDCDLRGASLAQAQLAGVVFRRCNLTSTHWRSARLDRVKFESCRMENVRWEGVDLSRTVMSEDMLAHADFAFVSKPPLNMRPAMESPPELEEARVATPAPPTQAQAQPGMPADTAATQASAEAPTPAPPAAEGEANGTSAAQRAPQPEAAGAEPAPDAEPTPRDGPPPAAGNRGEE